MWNQNEGNQNEMEFQRSQIDDPGAVNPGGFRNYCKQFEIG